MADTAGRLLRLLTLLQRQTSWGGQELADRLEVDARTVRRDVERLRELGYRVDASPGTGGGYRLGVGAALPPLQLDDDEAMAVAVVLGISAGVAVPGIERAALATLARLDRLLPPRLRAPLAALRASTVALLSPSEIVPTENLVRLAQACEAHERARFVYQARDGARSERRVEPHRLVTTDRRWYLVAYDLERQDWRTFRVDRVRAVRLTGHTFTPRPLEDPARMVNEGIAVAPYRYQAVAWVDSPATEVSRRLSISEGVVEPEGTGAIVKLGGDSFEWLAGRLVNLGLEFEVLEPLELRQYLASLGKQLVRAHATAAKAGAPETQS